ncbi:MAG TPA: hypothetical protein ENH06_00035, partial [bacterium]|nr:hypothetical protein [bacterium]
TGVPIDTNHFYYLPNLTTQIDFLLRRMVLNYFILTTLPNFEMSWHHIEWGFLVQRFKYLNIIAARGHGKSYFFTLAAPLWHMFRYDKKDKIQNRNYGFHLSRKGVIITAEYKLGTILMEEIKTEIEENEYLKNALLPDRFMRGEGSKKWGSEQITTKNGANLKVRSYGSKMRGLHPGWVVVDDLLTDAALYSPEQRRKYIQIFHSVIMNLLEPGGSINVVGTPFHEQDLYGDLKTKDNWAVFEYPGIFPDGTLLWPSKFNLDTLLERLGTIGSLNFTREILVKPISSESSVFPYEHIKRSYEGMDHFKLVDNIFSFPRKFDDIVVGTDFAISATTGADKTSFVVLGVEGQNYWILYIFLKGSMSYDEQMSQLKRINSNFQPSKIMVETNQMQKIFYQMGVDSGLPMVEHNTGVDKWSLEKGLPALAVLYENYRIKTPRGDQRSKDLTDLLAGELTSYTFEKNKLTSTSGHSDVGMALWQAVQAAYYVNSFDFTFL